jgi:hypothetical protein
MTSSFSSVAGIRRRRAAIVVSSLLAIAISGAELVGSAIPAAAATPSCDGVMCIIPVGGDGQSAPVGTSFAQTLQVQVTVSGAADPGVGVDFQQTSAGQGLFGGSDSSDQNVTDSGGAAESATLTAPHTPGAQIV